MKIFHVVILNKSVAYFFVFYKGMHSGSINPVLRTTYQNNFLFSRVNNYKNVWLEWVDVRDKWKLRAGCIEQIHCGYNYVHTGQSS